MSEETGEEQWKALHLFLVYAMNGFDLDLLPQAILIVAPGYAGQNNGMPHYHFVHGLPASMERESAVMKCRVAPGTAKTGNRDNDTPVQSQSERDSVFQRKAVAGNESSRQRTCRG